MNKDNQGGFTGNPEEQSYEDYLKQQQSEMAQEMSDAGKQAPKGAGGESGRRPRAQEGQSHRRGFPDRGLFRRGQL